MKKITRIFALALALVMAFALQAPVSGRESSSASNGQRNGSYDDDDRCHKSELCTIL